MIEVKNKLCVFSFGVAIGVAEGLVMLFLAWAGAMYGYSEGIIEQVQQVFPGYAPTFWGGLAGLFWGFLDGFIFGIIAAFVYNLVMHWCCKRTVKSPTTAKKKRVK